MRNKLEMTNSNFSFLSIPSSRILCLWFSNSDHITDFDFSSNNQYIASCSLDKTVRVWEISKGTCIRVVYGVSSQLCICFHPVSSNLAQFTILFLSFSLVLSPCTSAAIISLHGNHLLWTTLLQVNNNLLLVGNANKEINVNFFCLLLLKSQKLFLSNMLLLLSNVCGSITVENKVSVFCYFFWYGWCTVIG